MQIIGLTLSIGFACIAIAARICPQSLPADKKMQLIPYFALACAVAAPIFLLISRFLHRVVPIGDDTPFIFMMAVPLAPLLGAIVGGLCVANGWGSPRLARIALYLNLALFAVLAAVIVFGVASYSGRRWN